MSTKTTKPCASCDRQVPHHARGLCSACYARRRDDYPRVKLHRPYSAKEREFIRREWGKLSCQAIATRLGRKRQDVYSAAVRFGATKPRHVLKTDPALRRKMERLHAQGLSDREIGSKLGFGHGTVGRWLRRLGLASNCRTNPTEPFPERTRAKMRAIAQRRIKQEGSVFALPFLQKHLDGRIEAVRMGWPQAETLLEARILESLYQHGATTLAQLAEDVGGSIHWAGVVLRSLKRRKLTAVLYRIGGHVCAYGLAQGLKKSWEIK